MSAALHRLCNLSVDEAAEVLAAQATIGRMTKVSAPEWLASLGQRASNLAGQAGEQISSGVSSLRDMVTPQQWEVLRNAAIGTGVGAVGGGLMGANKKRRDILGTALSGATLGGLIGGAGTMATQHLSTGDPNNPGPTDAGTTQLSSRKDELLREIVKARGEAGAPRVPELTAELEKVKGQLTAANPGGEAPATPGVKVAPVADRLPAAAAHLADSQPLDAAGKLMPNYDRAITGAAAGGAAGAGVNVMRHFRPSAQRIQAMPDEALQKVIRDKPAVIDAINKAPLGMLPKSPAKAFPAEVQPYLPKLRAAKPPMRGKFMLPLAGALLGGLVGGNSGTTTIQPGKIQ